MIAGRVAVASKLKVIAYESYVTPEDVRDIGLTRGTRQDDVFGQAEVISIYTRLTRETEGIRIRSKASPNQADRLLINLLLRSLATTSLFASALNLGLIARGITDAYHSERSLKDNPLFELRTIRLAPHVRGSKTGARDSNSNRNGGWDRGCSLGKTGEACCRARGAQTVHDLWGRGAPSSYCLMQVSAKEGTNNYEEK